MARYDLEVNKRLVLSHRGYSRDVPENTLDSFERAITMGVDGIETDVRLSADGLLILFHDRCAAPGIPVSQLTHAELEKAVGYSVPTVESAVAAWGEVLWNLEIKEASALNAIVEFLNRYVSTRRFLITSFLHPLVYEVMRRVDVDGGLLFAHLPHRSKPSLDDNKRDPRPENIVWDYEISTAELMMNSAEMGFRNFVYGPITPQEHEEVSQWMVYGVITDFPQYLKTEG